MPLAKSLRVLVLANQKGGVGKTTTAINLGTALAAIDERVLLVDLDPQGNASTGLGIDRKSRAISTYNVMMGETSLADAVQVTAVPRLSVAPSTLDLLGRGTGDRRRPRPRLQAAPGGARLRRRAGRPRRRRTSYILVDCPPSLNLLTINALAAAHAVVVPLQCEFFALEGLTQLLATVDQVRAAAEPGAEPSTAWC